MEQIHLEALGEQGGDSRQPAWLHQGQVPPDQPSGFLLWSDCLSGQGKSNRCYLSGLISSIWTVLLCSWYSPTHLDI